MSANPEQLRSARPQAVPSQRHQRPVEPSTRSVERRRHDSPCRHSWASQQPFDLRVCEADETDGGTVDPVQRADQRRSAWTRPLTVRAIGADVLIAAGVAAGCTASLPGIRPLTPYAAMLGALIWFVAVLVNRGYESGRMGDGAEEFQAILRAAFSVVLLMGIASYAFQFLLPRREVLVAVPTVALLSGVVRHVQRRQLHERRYQGEAMLRTLAVGEPLTVQGLTDDLRSQASHGFDVVGACVPVPGPEVQEHLDIGVLGGLSEVPQIVVDHDIDSVIVVGSLLSGAALRRLSWALERTGAQLLVEPGLVEVAGPNVQLRPAAGLSLLQLERSSARSGRLLGKAALDRVLGTLLLVLASPVLAASALAFRLTSRGPAFFTQPRMGVDGTTFTMFKVRTMVQDADARREELLDQSSRDGLMFKMKHDPRVTRAGRFLRRFSIDELPQLLNVVRGDMSLVGPRPPLVSEYEQYHDSVHRRLRVRPGLTGLWQVSGRADLTWEESLRLDLRYVDNWSIALDLLILWKTARAVLGRSGAY
jgi:exopolysaccharide biosynthesis polyprenyl glycosylphosphotransferase